MEQKTMPYVKIFSAKALLKLRMWWTMTGMLISMMILLLQMRFWTTTLTYLLGQLIRGLMG